MLLGMMNELLISAEAVKHKAVLLRQAERFSSAISGWLIFLLISVLIQKTWRFDNGTLGFKGNWGRMASAI